LQKQKGKRLAILIASRSVEAAGINPTVSGWGGGMGEITHGDMGGSLYSNFNPPNSTQLDVLASGQPCPNDNEIQDFAYNPNANCNQTGGRKDCCLSDTHRPGDNWSAAQVAARSHHAGGVNASMADGSVRFFSSSINFVTWRQLGTIAGGENPTNY
jgi:prepilin-type processing-associated H-X9-DG protein